MSRSGSGSRSFLDDLLADDFDKPNMSAKRKSVRFMDNEDNTDIFTTNLMSSLSTRETSAKERQKSVDPLEWSKTDTSSPANKPIGGTKTSSKSDWLGLDGDEEVDGQQKTHTFSDKTQKQSTDEKDDWLNSGLNSRKNRAINELKTTTIDTKDKTEDNSWLNIRKKAEESKVKTTEPKGEIIVSQKEDIIENKTTNRSEPEKSSIKPNQQNIANIESMQTEGQIFDTNITTSLSTSSVMLLQTQVKMLELEKTYLQQTLDQIKVNHNEELKIMAALHEQQMAMTTDMYKRHEEMVQEERDRRINDLKTQLSQSERDIEDMRRRNNERVQYLENEWQREVERLKEMHSSTTKKLSEQHEQDLARIRKIKEQEIESVNALQNHGLSLESLLNKWEKSAQQIEELHKSVINKQEEILKHKFNDIQIKNKRLDEVEVNWHSLISELETERNRCSDETKKLYNIIEEQKHLLQTQQKRLIDERLVLDNDKRKLTEDKDYFDTETNKIRDNLRKESEAISEERLKLKDQFSNLETKKNEINIKEMESKQTLIKERDEINRLFKEVDDKRNELHREATQLQHQSMSVQNEQHQFEQRKLMFDIEKQKMQDLAQEIAKRAEELESLSEIALHEKREGHLAMDEADKFKRELDSRLKFIEDSFAQLKIEEDRITKMKVKVEQELDYIKETKDNIVCNLCGAGLNRAKINGMTTKQPLNEFNNISSYYPTNQWSGIQDNDRALLIWQISGQQDAALLEQETAFVNAIRSQTQTTGIAFQQNDYFFN